MSALLRMEGALADSRGSTLNKVVKALTLAGIGFVTRDDSAIGVILKVPNTGGKALAGVSEQLEMG